MRSIAILDTPFDDRQIAVIADRLGVKAPRADRSGSIIAISGVVDLDYDSRYAEIVDNTGRRWHVPHNRIVLIKEEEDPDAEG